VHAVSRCQSTAVCGPRHCHWLSLTTTHQAPPRSCTFDTCQSHTHSLQADNVTDNVNINVTISVSMYVCRQCGTAHIRTPLLQQSIDISSPPGPQQQTRSSGVRRSDETDRQTGDQQLHRPRCTACEHCQ